MPEPSMVHLVADSLAALRREAPEAYRRMGRALGGRTARFLIGSDEMVIRRAGDGVTLDWKADTVEVEVETTWGAVVDIVEGRRTLLDALLDGRVVARGGPEDVAAVHDGMMAYVTGAVRGASFPGMWRRVRATLDESARSASS